MSGIALQYSAFQTISLGVSQRRATGINDWDIMVTGGQRQLAMAGGSFRRFGLSSGKTLLEYLSKNIVSYQDQQSASLLYCKNKPAQLYHFQFLRLVVHFASSPDFQLRPHLFIKSVMSLVDAKCLLVCQWPLQPFSGCFSAFTYLLCEVGCCSFK